MSATTCVECGHPMLPNRAWRAMTREERRASGARLHKGRGLCSACQTVHQKAGTLLDVERLTITRGELLGELEILVLERGCTDTALLSETLGITRDALNNGLLRAVKAGEPLAIEIRDRLPFKRSNDAI